MYFIRLLFAKHKPGGQWAALMVARLTARLTARYAAQCGGTAEKRARRPRLPARLFNGQLRVSSDPIPLQHLFNLCLIPPESLKAPDYPKMVGGLCGIQSRQYYLWAPRRSVEITGSETRNREIL
ncbi:hypothetical protein HNQ38_002291 [Desulfovibrio intestinalis]|uniref:Uncharacterized protein n=1 Tax=Desulfovibrio intestinalis TaxID=58621 RepID=A0A7W8FFP7_9BACT|nr:hypothetical protein [Desulfovibrio intestinalis]